MAGSIKIEGVPSISSQSLIHEDVDPAISSLQSGSRQATHSEDTFVSNIDERRQEARPPTQVALLGFGDKGRAGSYVTRLYHLLKGNRLGKNGEKAQKTFKEAVGFLKSSGLSEEECQKYYRLMALKIVNAVERSLNDGERSILEHAANGTDAGQRGLQPVVETLRAQHGVPPEEWGDRELTEQDLAWLANPRQLKRALQDLRDSEKHALRALKRYTENPDQAKSAQNGTLMLDARYEIFAVENADSKNKKKGPHAELAYLVKDTEKGALVAMMSNGEAWIVREDGMGFKRRYREFLEPGSELQNYIADAGCPEFAKEAVYTTGDGVLDGLSVANIVLPVMGVGATRVSAARWRALQPKPGDLQGFAHRRQDPSGKVTVVFNINGNTGAIGYERKLPRTHQGSTHSYAGNPVTQGVTYDLPAKSGLPPKLQPRTRTKVPEPNSAKEARVTWKPKDVLTHQLETKGRPPIDPRVHFAGLIYGQEPIETKKAEPGQKTTGDAFTNYFNTGEYTLSSGSRETLPSHLQNTQGDKNEATADPKPEIVKPTWLEPDANLHPLPKKVNEILETHKNIPGKVSVTIPMANYETGTLVVTFPGGGVATGKIKDSEVTLQLTQHQKSQLEKAVFRVIKPY